MAQQQQQPRHSPPWLAGQVKPGDSPNRSGTGDSGYMTTTQTGTDSDRIKPSHAKVQRGSRLSLNDAALFDHNPQQQQQHQPNPMAFLHRPQFPPPFPPSHQAMLRHHPHMHAQMAHVTIDPFAGPPPPNIDAKKWKKMGKEHKKLVKKGMVPQTMFMPAELQPPWFSMMPSGGGAVGGGTGLPHPMAFRAHSMENLFSGGPPPPPLHQQQQYQMHPRMAGPIHPLYHPANNQEWARRFNSHMNLDGTGWCAPDYESGESTDPLSRTKNAPMEQNSSTASQRSRRGANSNEPTHFEEERCTNIVVETTMSPTPNRHQDQIIYESLNKKTKDGNSAGLVIAAAEINYDYRVTQDSHLPVKMTSAAEAIMANNARRYDSNRNETLILSREQLSINTTDGIKEKTATNQNHEKIEIISKAPVSQAPIQKATAPTNNSTVQTWNKASMPSTEDSSSLSHVPDTPPPQQTNDNAKMPSARVDTHVDSPTAPSTPGGGGGGCGLSTGFSTFDGYNSYTPSCVGTNNNLRTGDVSDIDFSWVNDVERRMMREHHLRNTDAQMPAKYFGMPDNLDLPTLPPPPPPPAKREPTVIEPARYAPILRESLSTADNGHRSSSTEDELKMIQSNVRAKAALFEREAARATAEVQKHAHQQQNTARNGVQQSIINKRHSMATYGYYDGVAADSSPRYHDTQTSGGADPRLRSTAYTHSAHHLNADQLATPHSQREYGQFNGIQRKYDSAMHIDTVPNSRHSVAIDSMIISSPSGERRLRRVIETTPMYAGVHRASPASPSTVCSTSSSTQPHAPHSRMRVYDRDRVRPVSLHSNEWLQANRKYDATEYYRRQILPQRQKEQERRANVAIAKRAPTNSTKQAIYRKSMDSASIAANSGDYGGVYIGPTGINGHPVKATTVAVYDC